MSRALRSSSTATMRCCSSSAVMVVLCIRSGPARGRGARAGMAVQGMLANLLPDRVRQQVAWRAPRRDQGAQVGGGEDRKSTRLNSSHVAISYAVFCLKKKKTNMTAG